MAPAWRPAGVHQLTHSAAGLSRSAATCRGAGAALRVQAWSSWSVREGMGGSASNVSSGCNFVMFGAREGGALGCGGAAPPLRRAPRRSPRRRPRAGPAGPGSRPTILSSWAVANALRDVIRRQPSCRHRRSCLPSLPFGAGPGRGFLLLLSCSVGFPGRLSRGSLVGFGRVLGGY